MATSSSRLRIFVTQGLEGQDDNFDILEKYFRRMQQSTIETSNPDNFIDFVACAAYFGVVMMEKQDDAVSNYNAGGETQHMYYEGAHHGAPICLSDDQLSSNIESEERTFEEILASFKALPEREKIAQWQEAFEAEIEEEGNLVKPMYDLQIDDDTPAFSTHSNSGLESIWWNSPSDIDYETSGINNEEVSDVEHVPKAGILSTTDIDSKMIESQSMNQNQNTSKVLQPGTYITLADSTREQREDVENAAIEYQTTLQAMTVARYEKKKRERAAKSRQLYTSPCSSSLHDTAAWISNRAADQSTGQQERYEQRPVGLVYLWPCQSDIGHPLQVGEYSMGIYIAPDYRDTNILVQALNRVVEQAFADKMCHRIQSIVIDHEEKLWTLELLSALGFRHEGTCRRAFYSPVFQEWRDVTYFGMLATEWVYDNSGSSVRLRTASLFEEILTRHQRELDELFRLQEVDSRRLKRAISSETVQKNSEKSRGKRPRLELAPHQYRTRRRLSVASSNSMISSSSVSGLESDWSSISSIPKASTSSQPLLYRGSPGAESTHSSDSIDSWFAIPVFNAN